MRDSRIIGQSLPLLTSGYIDNVKKPIDDSFFRETFLKRKSLKSNMLQVSEGFVL